MNEPKPQEIPVDVEIDRLIHQPARLKILAYLSLVESADFVFLAGRIGLTMGNLSAHVTKLEEADYVTVTKQFIDNRPNTMISLSKKGKKAFTTYRNQILDLIQST